MHAFLAYLTCTENSDYDPSMVPDQIVFSLSKVGIEQCFDVMIIDDDAREGTEYFILTFDTKTQNPQVTLTPRIFIVEITDNDEGNSSELR